METQLSKKKIGSDIDSWCGTCQLVLAHTIEAMVGDKPARVHCNTCKSQHSYNPTPPDSAPRQRDALKGQTRPPARARANRYQALLREKDSAVAKPYSPKDKYEPGDVLEHATFGRGVATAVKDGSKIEVLFQTGSKTLVHGR